MEISDQLIEALDWVVETWMTQETPTSREAAHEAGAQLLEVMAEDYDYIGRVDEVVPDLVNEMLARSGEDDVWLGRTAGLHCIIEGLIQATAAEQARNN
jgi:hypothetical protein